MRALAHQGEAYKAENLTAFPSFPPLSWFDTAEAHKAWGLATDTAKKVPYFSQMLKLTLPLVRVAITLQADRRAMARKAEALLSALGLSDAPWDVVRVKDAIWSEVEPRLLAGMDKAQFKRLFEESKAAMAQVHVLRERLCEGFEDIRGNLCKRLWRGTAWFFHVIRSAPLVIISERKEAALKDALKSALARVY